jgi:ABC-type uncharacterized transport system permease subunit
MQSAASFIAVVLYLSAAMLAMMRLKRRAKGIEFNRTFIFAPWAVALIVHALVLFKVVVLPEGLNLEFLNALSMVALLVAAILFSATLKRPLENLAIAVLPATAASLILTRFIPHQAKIAAPANSAIEIHILISLLAFSLLSIAVLQAILLSIQDRHLHNRHPGGLIRALPPLQLMEHLLFQLIAIGFLFLSMSLISGFLFLEDIFAQHLVHKTVLSTAAWLIFATLLWGRWQYGWRGRIAIRWTVGGGIFLLLAYFGSKLVLELLLKQT